MGALAIVQGPAALAPIAPDFMPGDLAIFTSIPPYRHGIVALNGMVVVYATDLIGQEGVVEGAYYVRENQRPVANMSWQSWLQFEVDDPEPHRRCRPRSPLQIEREVVKAFRRPRDGGSWSVLLPSGYVDGPYHDWAFGCDFVGKVVGLFLPEAGRLA